MGDGLKQINDGLVSFFDMMDVTSTNFFLTKAFVPSPDYLDTTIMELKSSAEVKFPVFGQMKDTFNSVKQSIGADKVGWQGISINLNKWGVGTIKVINPTYVNEAGPKLKYWIGAIMYFFTIMYVIKKVSTIIGVGR